MKGEDLGLWGVLMHSRRKGRVHGTLLKDKYWAFTASWYAHELKGLRRAHGTLLKAEGVNIKVFEVCSCAQGVCNPLSRRNALKGILGSSWAQFRTKKGKDALGVHYSLLEKNKVFSIKD